MVIKRNIGMEAIDKKTQKDLDYKPATGDSPHLKTSLSPYPQSSWRFMIFYHTIFWSGGTYGLYKFYLLSQKWKRILELTEKESIFGTHQDQNDLEWKIFIPMLVECAPYGILHLIIMQISRCYFPHVLRIMYIVFGSVMLLKILGPLGTGLSYLIPVAMFLVLFSRLKPLIWLTWCFLLIFFNCTWFQQFLEKAMNDNGEREYKTSVIVAWIMLRCVSFCLVTCDQDPGGSKPHAPLLVDLLAYSFYFPNLITGPFVPYKDYVTGVAKPFERWDLKKLAWFGGQFLRFMIWLGLADLLLYSFYAHSLIFNPTYIESFNSWTMAGYYSFLLVFFLLKYVVMYGLPSVLARAEGYSPPDPPRCVLLVRRYSDIWRYFDVGLHRFMVDHIYVPFLGGDGTLLRQMQGAVIAFTFIYVWHGASPSVLWWCVINFVFTVVEKLVDKFVDTPLYRGWENSLLPGVLGRIFRLLSTGLFLSLSMNALIIFLTSVEHAQVVFHNIYIKGFPVTTASTVFFFSLMAQGGIDLYDYRMRRKLKRR